ncbi:unnamed protein product [Soboliphyme baturini]|uniref:PseudoU_synth_2 domain-containing protein n=1 Tax=Soboliphyme baturini TaxID=241478 RepID=A0A183IBY0_9BILA|nr:unnamed protein product [Soboliphyme baturini]
MNKELHSLYANYFEDSIKLGRITVNDAKVDVSYKLKDSDIVRNICHRHEMPVLDRSVKIIADTDELIAINKPCSLPAKNVLHRLDRLTSGLVIMPKSLEVDVKLKSQILSRQVKKEYVCMVEGEFLSDEVTCEQPLKILHKNMGIQQAAIDGKACCTTFKRLCTDGKHSLILCLPVTGRTHQIRVHLQYLGFPIVNDQIYNNEVFGSCKGKDGKYGKTVEQLITDVSKAFGSENWINDYEVDIEKFMKSRNSSDCSALSHMGLTEPPPPYDQNCPSCHLTFKDPKAEDLELYLHCWRYTGPDWSFECPLPDWATDLMRRAAEPVAA